MRVSGVRHALFVILLLICVQQCSFASRQLFRFRDQRALVSEDAGEDSAGGSTSSGSPSTKPRVYHDKFKTNFEKNLAVVAGAQGALNMKKIMYGWTGTNNRLSMQPIPVSATDVKIFDQKSKAEGGMRPMYIRDLRTNLDQMVLDEYNRKEALRAKAKVVQQNLLEHSEETARQHPPAKLPFPAYFNGPKTATAPGLIGGMFGPASALPVGTTPLKAPPMLAGGEGGASAGSGGGGDGGGGGDSGDSGGESG